MQCETAVQPVVGRTIVFPSIPKGSQVASKAKLFTFVPNKVEEKMEERQKYPPMVKPLQSQSWGHVNLTGVLNVQEAMNSLADLGRFITGQDAMMRSLESSKSKTEEVDMLVKRVQKLEDQLAVANREKADLQQSYSDISMQLNVKMEEILQYAFEFGAWEDGLKEAVDIQFKSFEDKFV